MNVFLVYNLHGSILAAYFRLNSLLISHYPASYDLRQALMEVSFCQHYILQLLSLF